MITIDTDFLGLQIVSLEDATVAGEVDGLIIDDVSTTLAGFLVNLGLREASVLPFSSVRAIGIDAVVVASQADIAPLSSDPALEALAAKDVMISEATALTVSGTNAGIIGDFFVDTETGTIAGVQLIPADQAVYRKEPAVIPAFCIRRLGQDLVVIEDNYRCHLLKDGESLERMAGRGTGVGAQPEPPGEAAAPSEGAAATPPEAEVYEDAASAAPEEAEASRDAAPAPAPFPWPVVQPKPEGADEPCVEAQAQPQPEPRALEKEAGERDTLAAHQRHFLLGKRVIRRIEGPSGEIIAEEGDIVDQEMIRKAKAADQLLVLSLSVE